MIFLLIATGLVLLPAGGELVVRGSVRLSRTLNISPLVVGVIVIGFGTSLPEVVVSINAAVSGSPGLAVGNVVGSNIANSLLVIGLPALFAPVIVETRAVLRDGVGLLGVTIVFVGICLHGVLNTWMAISLLALLCLYIVIATRTGSGSETRSLKSQVGVETTKKSELGKQHFIKTLLIVLAGFIAIAAGAECLVSGAVELARRMGVSNEIIGLTIVAIGTSLPELVTALVAAYRRQTDLSLGNVLGSNIFNLAGVAGVTGLVVPLPISDSIAHYDVWVLAGTTALLFMFMWSHYRISRLEGGILFAVYCLYIGSLIGFWPGAL